MRAADVGLTFITVAAGLLLESGDLHAASRSLDLAPVAPDDTGPSSELRAGSQGSRVDLPAAGSSGPVADAADRPALPRSTAGELSPVELGLPTSRPARPSHRPRGPPGR